MRLQTHRKSENCSGTRSGSSSAHLSAMGKSWQPSGSDGLRLMVIGLRFLSDMGPASSQDFENYLISRAGDKDPFWKMGEFYIICTDSKYIWNFHFQSGAIRLTTASI